MEYIEDIKFVGRNTGLFIVFQTMRCMRTNFKLFLVVLPVYRDYLKS